MKKNLIPWLAAAALGAAFLAWHEPWFIAPLSPQEVAAAFDGPLGQSKLPEEEKANLKTFFSNDDGKAFYNLNLLQYRAQAQYPDGSFPDVKTGLQANDRYNAIVVPLLLQRASYPVLISSKLSNLLHAGPGTDFFQEVAIVRYRSRRDMLDMILSPEFRAGYPHKYASLEKTVAAPLRGLLVIDGTVVVPLLLFAAALVSSLVLSRQSGKKSA